MKPAILSLVACAFVVACAPVQLHDGVALDPDDAALVPVDANKLVDDSFFASGDVWTLAQVQRYFERTHYGRRSFLADYRSGACDGQSWCSAAGAVVAAAKRYRLNATLLLAFAQVFGQLLSASKYPVPAERVEVVFGCGCTVDACPAVVQGFDRQVDCLGQQLRAAFDAASSGGGAPRGLVIGASFTTVDGVSVQPANAASASVYSVVPELAPGRGGAWLVAALTAKIHP